MARIVDRNGHCVEYGDDLARLTETMVAHQERAYRKMGHRPKALTRVSFALVKSAVRRDAPTDAGQRLDMTEQERRKWTDLYPLPED